MCPVCLANMTFIAASATSTGGLTAFVARKFYTAKENRMTTADFKTSMNRPIVSRQEWLTARRDLLAQEKESSRQRDALNAERRNLPVVRVESEYVFDGPGGRTTLRDLFGPHSQLLTYHFMFDPSWEEGCKSCSHLMDGIAGSLVHLAARDTAFVAVSRAPIAKIEAFKKRMGWTFPWVSSGGNDFNYDFHATLDAEHGSNEYNYANSAELFKARKIWFEKGDLPAMSVFVRDGESVFHSYSTYQRGLDLFLSTYNLLDLTPLGRQEDDGRIQAWIRHHDKYPA